MSISANLQAPVAHVSLASRLKALLAGRSFFLLGLLAEMGVCTERKSLRKQFHIITIDNSPAAALMASVD